MSSQEILLWGFDGDFSANEDRIMLRLPACFVPATGKYFAARSGGWNLEPEGYLVWFQDKNDASSHVTELELCSPVGIKHGQQIALMGPRFWDYLANIAPPEFFDAFVEGWSGTPNGFAFKLMMLPEYNAIEDELAALSLDVFDREIGTAQGKDLTRKAKSALNILRVNPNVLLIEKARRVIVAEGIINLNRYLTHYSKRLKVAPEVLKEEVEKYLKNLTDQGPEKS